jgi:VanZ family protein
MLSLSWRLLTTRQILPYVNALLLKSFPQGLTAVLQCCLNYLPAAMKQKYTPHSPDSCSGIRLFFLHAACLATVVFYVNMFQFWAWLRKQLGPGFMADALPVMITLVVLVVIGLRFVHRVNRGYRIKFLFLGLGIVAAFFSLAIPDPHVPIKRIHVAEYIALSFLVRYTLSHRLQGAQLTLFTVLVTMLYGVHDEMLQGLHSLRYYGWRDITVNGMGGLSGSLLGHGLMSFERPGVTEVMRRKGGGITPGAVLVYGFLFAAVALHVYLLYQQRGSRFTTLSLLPLTGACLLTGILYPGIVMNSQRHHGLQAVFWLALGLLVYPLVANLAGMEFL